MPRSNDPHSVHNEPHLRPRVPPPQGDDDETRAAERLRREAARPAPEYRDGQSIYDEPDMFPGRNAEIVEQDWTCSRCGYNLRGLPTHHPCPECGHRELYRPAPSNATSYAVWLRARQAETSEAKSWGVAIVLALLGGPWAVITALMGADPMTFTAGAMLLLVVVFGPLTEEVMKVGLVLWAVETRPYLFRRVDQIQLATIGAALVFAVIENLIYLNIYIPNASLLMVLWRWTVCVALHIGCTLVATRGLVAVWQRATTESRRPQLDQGLRWIVIAAIIHAAYNFTAVALEYANVF